MRQYMKQERVVKPKTDELPKPIAEIKRLIKLCDTKNFTNFDPRDFQKMAVIHDISRYIPYSGEQEKMINEMIDKKDLPMNVAVNPIVVGHVIYKACENGSIKMIKFFIQMIKPPTYKIELFPDVVDKIFAFSEKKKLSDDIIEIRQLTIKLMTLFLEMMKPSLEKVEENLSNNCWIDDNSREMMKYCSKIHIQKGLCCVVTELGHICSQLQEKGKTKCKYHEKRLTLDEMDRIHS